MGPVLEPHEEPVAIRLGEKRIRRAVKWQRHLVGIASSPRQSPDAIDATMHLGEVQRVASARQLRDHPVGPLRNHDLGLGKARMQERHAKHSPIWRVLG
jgi:hypothetical protein